MSPEPEGSTDNSLKITNKTSGDDTMPAATTTGPSSNNILTTDLLSYNNVSNRFRKHTRRSRKLSSYFPVVQSTIQQPSTSEPPVSRPPPTTLQVPKTLIHNITRRLKTNLQNKLATLPQLDPPLPDPSSLPTSHTPKKQHHSNPYKRQPDPKINQAISQIQQISRVDNSTHGSVSNTSSVQSDDLPPVILRTLNRRTRHLRRAIRVPERLTYAHNNPLSQNSQHTHQSTSTSSSSTISPQAQSRTASSAAKSSSRRNEILKTFQEISSITTELQASMSKSSSSLNSLSFSQTNTSNDMPQLSLPDLVIYGSPDIADGQSMSSLDHMSVQSSSSSSTALSSESDVTPHPEEYIPSPITLQNPSPAVPDGAVQIHEFINVTNKNKMYDDIGFKTDNHFRLILQNTRGIHEFKQNDPEYFPTMTALKEAGADIMCFVETNTPWHKSDMIYDISTVNKMIWDTPTKTVGASCRTEGKSSNNYLPGGALNVIANSLTTKIQSTTTDLLGRWIKVRFFAKGGSLVIYTVYRPNPSSISRAGVNSAWMQQYRHLSKENKNCDPRKKLMTDLCHDIHQEQLMQSRIVVVGDFNEDINDNEKDGIYRLEHECDLIQAFREIKGHIPSTRGNNRAIDHIFVDAYCLQHIRSLGFVPDEVGFSSDHMGLFMDFTPAILDTKNTPIPPAPSRTLKMYNTPKVQEYITNVLTRFEDHNIVNRIKKLHVSIKQNGFKNEAQTILENIDTTVTGIMLQAEKDLIPSQSSYKFSIDLAIQMRKVRLLKAIINKKAKSYPLETYVNWDMEQYAEEWLRLDLQSLEMILQEEREHLIFLQENSDDGRDGHQDFIIERTAEEKQTEVQHIVKEMKARESQARIFKHIGAALKTKTYSSVNKIGLPTDMQHDSTETIWNNFQSMTQDEIDQLEWVYLEDPAIIETRLLEWNVLHFNQASKTQLGTEKWEQKLNPCKRTDAELDDILNNTLTQDDDLTPEATCLLKQIQSNIRKPMPKSMTHIEQEEFCAFFRKTPEDKSSSPSGLHLGHYKAAARNDDFSYVVWSLMYIAYTNEYCLNRWKHSGTILLEKVPGFPKINKFRTIHLIESDLNFIMRRIWGREFMIHNECHDGFHDNQYGGRKGRQPQSAVLNKVLSLDIIRYYGEPSAMVDNDATACYDRILPYLTTYMLKRLGMPYFLSRFMCNVLREMQYSIRTDKGLSDRYSSKDRQLYGTGQGAGWSPPCWAANSDVISHAMATHTPGLLLVHPNKQVRSNRHLDVFVDDTNHGVTHEAMESFHPQDPAPVVPKCDHIYEQVQANMKFYHGILEATGGALAWPKCKAYIMLFEWCNGIKRLVPTKDKYPPLTITTSYSNETFHIKLANPDEAFKMLGAFVALDGNVKEQIKVLKKYADKWAAKMKLAYLTPHEAIVAYTQVLFPALVYPLAMIALTEKECDSIIQLAIAALLQKINLPKITSRLLLYGHPRLGGLGLPNLYVHSNILKTMMLLGHLQKNDSTATIMTIALGTAQQQIGISIPLLESNYSKYEFLLEPCWLKTVWKFLHEIGGSITIPSIWIQKSPFTKNICIMDKILEMNIPAESISKFNLCRLFKEVHFLTDIMDSRFKKLHPAVFNRSKIPSKDMKWPCIAVPTPYWKIWDVIIQTIYMSVSVSGFFPGHIIRKHLCRFLQSGDRKHLLSKIGEKRYHVYTLTSYQRRKYVYSRKDIHFTTRFSLVGFYGVQVTVTHDYITTEGYWNEKSNIINDKHIINLDPSQPYTVAQHIADLRRQHYMMTPPRTPIYPTHMTVPPSKDERVLDMYEELAQLDPMLQRNLGHITKLHNIAKLVEGLESGKALAVADASLGTRERASHAYVITTLNDNARIEGEAPVDCDPDDLESTRSEIYGMIAIQTLLNVIGESLEVTCGEINIYCDNIDALGKNPQNTILMSYPRFFRPNIDLKLLLWKLRQETPHKLKISLSHIKGHQDSKKEFNFDEAPKSVQLNIEMDAKAKHFLKRHQGSLEPKQIPLPLPTQKAYLSVSSTLVSNNISHHISLHFFAPKMENRLKRVTELTKHHREQIHWRAIEWAYKKYSVAARLPIFKLLHNKWMPAMSIAKFDPDKSPQCIRCDLQVETFLHIFQCSSIHAREVHTNALNTLKSSLRRNNTAPIITEAITQVIGYARKGYYDERLKQVMASDEMKTLARDTIKQQLDIGIKAFLQGYISRNWAVLQNIYLKYDDFNDDNVNWTRALVSSIWEYSTTIWSKRCEQVNGKLDSGIRLKNRREIIKTIEEHLKRTKYSPDYETQQLRRNIKTSMGNANITSLQIWLRMIRTVKETEIQDKNQERIRDLRAQSITRFLVRQTAR